MNIDFNLKKAKEGKAVQRYHNILEQWVDFGNVFFIGYDQFGNILFQDRLYTPHEIVKVKPSEVRMKPEDNIWYFWTFVFYSFNKPDVYMERRVEDFRTLEYANMEKMGYWLEDEPVIKNVIKEK